MKRLVGLFLILALLLCGVAAVAEGGDAPDMKCAIENGSYVIRIADPNGDLGWLADDMAQDDSVVALGSAGLVDGEYVVRYDPVGDGQASVHVRHYVGIACDQMHGWDLTVKDGAVVECTGGSFTASPDPSELDPFLIGAWETGDGDAIMIVEKNPAGSAWDVEISSGAGQDGYVFMTTVYHDCDLDGLVYDKGKFWDAPEADELGEASAAGTTGIFVLSGETQDDVSLAWTDDRQSETLTFRRQPSEYTYFPEMEAYEGEWVSGDMHLEIVHSFDDYNVMNCVVTQMTSEHEGVRWIYDSCSYDDVGCALSSFEIGMKLAIALDGEGEIVSNEEIYTDGAAAFKLNDDGTLTWTDFKEEPGANEVVFERQG